MTIAPDGPRRSALLQERSRRTRRDLVRAALELWTDRGFERGIEGTTVEEIARAAGVTKGTFYFHFARKEDILRELGWGASASLLDDARAAMAADRALADVLTEMLRALAGRVAKVERAAVRRSISEFYRPPVGRSSADEDEGHVGFPAAFREALVHAQQRGELPEDVDVVELASLLTAVTTDAIQRWTLADDEDLGAVMVRRATLVVAGATAVLSGRM